MSNRVTDRHGVLVLSAAIGCIVLAAGCVHVTPGTPGATGVRVAGGMTAAELAQKHNQSGLLPMLRCAENLRPGEAFGKHCE